MTDTDPASAGTQAVSDASRVRRQPDRATYDPASVHAVLDACALGHLGFVADQRPVVIPMLFGRDGDVLYLHGSVASRLQRTVATGIDVSFSAAVVDGLVLARSAFHHSMNYRSVVVLGRAVAVDGEERTHGLRAISEHLLAGRWEQSREPNDVELRQTSVLRLPIVEASAKARTGGPVDEADDIALPIWAGVIPCTTAWGQPIAEADSHPDAPIPPARAIGPQALS
jgi:uncharacterized protein